MSGIKEKFLQHYCGKKKYYNFWSKMYKVALRGMNIGNGAGFDSSGEKFAIQYIKQNVIKSKKPVIFDIGANVGGYSNELLKYFDQVAIHSFEPAHETFSKLSANVKSSNVTLNNFGMSDKCAEITLYYPGDFSGLSSIYNRQCFEETIQETVRMDTIDNYCEEKNISHIDFLKLDIEGNELNALQGGERMLKSGSIDAIQMEFGGCNIDSRTYFRDFWNLLNKEYNVYRVLLDGLWQVDEYEDILETFFCTNYLFIKK